MQNKNTNLVSYIIETLAPKSQPQYAIHLTSCVYVCLLNMTVSCVLPDAHIKRNEI